MRSLPNSKAEPPNLLLAITIDAVGIGRLPRILALSGCRTTLLSPSKVAARHSRFVRRWIPAPADPREAAAALRLHLRQNPHAYRHVIVGDEPLLWALRADPGEWLRAWFPAPLQEPELGAVFSKLLFATASAVRGLPLPEFRLCRTWEEAHAAARAFGYPLVLKADQGLSGSGVRVCRTKEELRHDFSLLGQGSPCLLAQRFVPGPLGTTPVLFSRGRPVCWFSAYTREHWPTPFTSSTALEIVHRPEMEPLLQSLGQMTGFHGLGGVDWIEEPGTGQLLLLEFNPRPTPGLYLGPKAGVDFARALRGWLSGHDEIQRPTGAGAFLPMFPQALYRAIDDRRFSLLRAALADAPFSDPLFAGAHLRRLATHYARRLLARG